MSQEKGMAEGNFEAGLDRLQEIVKRLEAPDTTLERAVELYREGVGLVRDCRERLQSAQNEIQILSAGVFVPFDGEDEDGEEDADE